MSYQVRLTPSAEKDLKTLPRQAQPNIVRQLQELADNPRPPGAIRVKSQPPGNYRVRCGDIRVGYEVQDAEQTVIVWQIGDRKRFYDKARRHR